MEGLVEFEIGDGVVIAVEQAEDLSGSQLVRRQRDGAVQATHTFEESLDRVRSAAESALRVFRNCSVKPDTVEIEFGVKLSAEAGAVIAKSTVEGHLVVTLAWSPQSADGSPGTTSAS